MIYVVLFFAGMMIGAGTLLIWYFNYIGKMRKERQQLTNWHDQLKATADNLHQKDNDLQNRQQDFGETVAAFDARKVQYEDLLGENNSLKQCFESLGIGILRGLS